jgi:homospermidine synthase
VAAGVYGAFIWGCMNPNAGCRWPEQIDTNIVLDKSLPYIGQFMSVPVDLNKTSL